MGLQLSRRRLLVGATVAGALGLGGSSAVPAATSGVPHPGPAAAAGGGTAARPATSSSRAAVARTEWERSAARNRSVRLVTVLPRGMGDDGLPVCLALHGLHGNAGWWSDAGLRNALGNAWAAGVPPFALVAVDGGDNYWHPYTAGDDPMAMLLDELPGWLARRGLGGSTGVPSVVTGVSMGGTGALLYARRRAELGQRVGAVAAMSPGLFLSWSDAHTRPFRGEADWAANDPLRFFPELAGTPLGVWCGDGDSFAEPVRRLILLARPEVGVVTPGRHETSFYSRIMPDVIRFLGRSLAPSPLLPGVG